MNNRFVVVGYAWVRNDTMQQDALSYVNIAHAWKVASRLNVRMKSIGSKDFFLIEDRFGG